MRIYISFWIQSEKRIIFNAVYIFHLLILQSLFCWLRSFYDLFAAALVAKLFRTLEAPLPPWSKLSSFASLMEEMDLVVCGCRMCALKDEVSWPEVFLRGRRRCSESWWSVVKYSLCVTAIEVSYFTLDALSTLDEKLLCLQLSSVRLSWLPACSDEHHGF